MRAEQRAAAEEQGRQAPEAALLRRGGPSPSPRGDGREAVEPPGAEVVGLRWGQHGMRGGWHLLRQEPSLVLWPVLLKTLQGIVEVAPLGVVAVAVLVRLGLGMEQGLLGALVGVARQVVSPGFLLGAGGLWGVAWTASWCLGVAMLGGVLGALLRRLQAGPVVIAQAVFWRTFGEGFGLLLGWSLLRGLCLAAAAGLGAGLVVLGASALAGAPLALQAAGLASLGAVGVGLLGAVALPFHVSLPYLLRGEQGVFGALGEGAWLIARRPAEALWLHGLEGALALVVLSVYLPFAFLMASLGGSPELAALGSVGRMGLDLISSVAFAVVSVWSLGATSTWVGLCEGWWRGVPGASGFAALPPWARRGASGRLPAVPLEAARAALPQEPHAPVSWEEARRRLLGPGPGSR